jgi:hypothetical protein
MKIVKLLVAAAMTVGLAACSGEPSATDMLAALNENPKFVVTLGLIAGLGGGNPAQVNALKDSGVVDKSGCVAAQGSPGYVCDFRWGSKQPDGTIRYGAPAKARFFKTEGGWAAEI